MSLSAGRDCLMMTTTNKSDKDWLNSFVLELRRKKMDTLADALFAEINKVEDEAKA